LKAQTELCNAVQTDSDAFICDFMTVETLQFILMKSKLCQ